MLAAQGAITDGTLRVNITRPIYGNFESSLVPDSESGGEANIRDGDDGSLEARVVAARRAVP